MEYLVFARKCRPQIFDDVVGQDHIVRTLKNGIRQNRIAHAFLFSGPRGVGKTSVARILAKALNCEKGPTDDPCNKCEHCREITEGRALDVREIDGASNRGIDEIRDLREHVRFSPSSSHYKVYIIDEVHMLTKEAFNALLKTLEEPPAHAVFIFATTEIHKIPATILSRCQHFDFRRLPLGLIIDNLAKIAEAEKIAISRTALSWISQAAEGGLRDAQSVFDQVVAYAGTEVKDEDVETLLGREERRYLLDLSEAVLAGKAGDALHTIDGAYYAGLDMKLFYDLLLGNFMNLLTLKITENSALLEELTDHEQQALEKQVAKLDSLTVRRYVDILMEGGEDIRRSPNPRFNLEYMVVRMAHLEPLIPINEVLARMERLEERLASSTGAAEGTVPSRIVPGKELPKQAAAEGYRGGGGRVVEALPQDHSWDSFVTFVKKRNPLLGSKIEGGFLLKLTDECLTIGFAEKYVFLDSLAEEPQRVALMHTAREFFGKDISVSIETVTSAAQNLQENKGERQSIDEIKREALNHPLVQKVIDVFEDAQIHDIICKNNNV